MWFSISVKQCWSPWPLGQHSIVSHYTALLLIQSSMSPTVLCSLRWTVQAPFGALSLCRTVRLTACCVNAGTAAHAPSSNTTARAPAPSTSNYGNSSSRTSMGPPPRCSGLTYYSLVPPCLSPAAACLVSKPCSQSPAVNASPFFSAAISSKRTGNLCCCFPNSCFYGYLPCCSCLCSY